MRSASELLNERFKSAIAAAFGLDPATVEPRLSRSKDEKFGDYQSNCAMGLAKTVGEKPRDVAAKIVEALDVDDLADKPEIAGPGFINIRLKASFVAGELSKIARAPVDGVDRLGIAPTDKPITVAVDMSSPNLAKEMHVGHIRSTVNGDCVAHVLEFVGHRVHRINHVGDWGTQFGMLLSYLRRTQPDVLENPDDLRLGDLEEFYVAAKNLFDSDPAFADESRRTVVELQAHDPQVMAVWRAFCQESLRHCHAIYELLDVRIEDRGESYYSPMLPEIVKAFEDKGLAVESDGALCVFPDRKRFRTRDDEPLPMIVRKSDGGYNYDTTDLAAIRHRIEELGATRLVYVVGAPQKQHFDMLFAAARLVGWAGDDVSLEHLAFGSMMGEDGKPFKTRSGGTVKLKDLLEEAVARARKVVAGSADLSETEIDEVASAVAIGAVKYYDLSHNLTTDYRFSWDHMLAMEGNTAPYMMYAYARVRSIGRKAGVDFAELPDDAEITLSHDSEVKLGKALLRFVDVIELVARELKPNLLTDYLYDLSKAFSTFYDRQHGVRVIDAEPESVRVSRLRLCDLTARALKLGLGLLGIKTVEQM
jgi:arginyl-tRNA synthetase